MLGEQRTSEVGARFKLARAGRMELHRATHDEKYAVRSGETGRRRWQHYKQREYVASQKSGSGDSGQPGARKATPYVRTGLLSGDCLPIALLSELAIGICRRTPMLAQWRDAVRLYLDDYALPMSARSAYGVMPLGVYIGSPTAETYRPLEGEMTYRYFMPTRRQFWWLGATSHLESNAVLMAAAAKAFGKPEYRDCALRHLEWVMGMNPFGACLMTGEGWRNSYPYSRFVGPLIGGIVNGIAGNEQDVPILQMEYGSDWRTGEYWTPHNASTCGR